MIRRKYPQPKREGARCEMENGRQNWNWSNLTGVEAASKHFYKSRPGACEVGGLVRASQWR